MTFVDDLDAPSDSPRYPEAATMEPIVALFGGEFESAEKAKEFIIKDISKWCTDQAIDVVDMYEWLWPTEVDPDMLEEEHRTAHAGFTQELNTVMKQRKKTMETTAEARAQSAAFGVPLNEINPNNEELPDASEIIKATKPGMWIQDGGITQYDAEGNEIKTFEDALPVVGGGFRVDDGTLDISKLFARTEERKAGRTGYESDDHDEDGADPDAGPDAGGDPELEHGLGLGSAAGEDEDEDEDDDDDHLAVAHA
jgi:hypothetical protein